METTNYITTGQPAFSNSSAPKLITPNANDNKPVRQFRDPASAAGTERYPVPGFSSNRLQAITSEKN